jgi:hypothetical protein
LIKTVLAAPFVLLNVLCQANNARHEHFAVET